MIFKIRMPIVEDLINWLDDDDNGRNDLDKPLPHTITRPRLCFCACLTGVNFIVNTLDMANG